MQIGKVLAAPQPPNTSNFYFLVKKNIKKGQFVQVNYKEGILLGQVSEIFNSNIYFESVSDVAGYERYSSVSLNFPVSEGENTIAMVDVYSVFKEGIFSRCFFPVSPGDSVFDADQNLLVKFLKFDQNGLNIGKLQHHDLDVKLSIERLLRKHLAILAMSGAGKSYLTCVLIEEILKREEGFGNLAVVVIDSHGEYVGFKKGKYEKSTYVLASNQFRIPFRKISSAMIQEWLPSLSSAQYRELLGILEKIKKEEVSLEDAIKMLESSEKTNSTKKSLAGWLYDLARLKIFEKEGTAFEKQILPGKLFVFDLSDSENQKRKQILVSYICKRLFKLAKKKKIPPFLLIIEEAHNFAPEKIEKNKALAKNAIIKIAREGRKFGACLCLISQRPVHLSTTALSQCNTNIILKITNPNDLKHISESCEGISAPMLKSITTLSVGEGLIVGEAVGSPIFVKVRKRDEEILEQTLSLEEMAKRFEEERRKKQQDSQAFL
jgi:hypothetical protein